MQFKIGDLVIHPAFGIGHITEIEEKSFSQQQEAQLYYKVVQPGHSMWTRAETEGGTGLRLIATKGDLDQYRDLLKSPPVALNTNLEQRHLDLINRLTEGSFQGVCEVMRDLTARGKHEPLDQAETTILQKTRDSLSKEWATVAGVSITEAIKEIDSLLPATQHAHRG
jgi:RNA polymerase-interacting CarD/CdnL/TRCF family regulator